MLFPVPHRWPLAALLFWVALPSLVAAQVDEAVLEAEARRVAVIDRAKDSVLAIFSATGAGGGSGVVISPDGYALTNFHVAKPCGIAMKCGMPDGRLYDAVVVGYDPTGDVALIKLLGEPAPPAKPPQSIGGQQSAISGQRSAISSQPSAISNQPPATSSQGRHDFPCATLGDSDQVQVGDWVFAMGNPFLLATDFQPTVTYGIISGVDRYQYPAGTFLEYTDCLQTDASINPGNSGGPLFDAQGRLIGLNGRASFEKRGRVNVGAGYAISINQIENFLGYLRSGRIVDHATLGATVVSDEQGRVVTSDIRQQSDAYRRGLRYDDEIVRLAGRPIFTPNGFKNVLGIYPKGWRVPLSFRRGSRRYDVLVRLAGAHSEAELLEKAQGRRTIRPVRIPQGGDREPGTPGPKQPKPVERGGTERQKQEAPPIPIRRPAGGPQPPLPMPGGPSGQPLPEIVRRHFEARRGYANYYFNRLSRDRVWRAWTARGDFASLDGSWTMAGPLEGGGSFRLQLTGVGATLELPTVTYRWTAGDELGASLDPPGSGGLLPALFLWRRLAVEACGRFGEVFYLGTMPWVRGDLESGGFGRFGIGGFSPARSSPEIPKSRDPETPDVVAPGMSASLVDVLVGIHGGVECRFLFDPAEGFLLALEMFPEEDVDPCEVYFLEYREVEGRWLPGRMEVRFGDQQYATFQLDTFDLEKHATGISGVGDLRISETKRSDEGLETGGLGDLGIWGFRDSRSAAPLRPRNPELAKSPTSHPHVFSASLAEVIHQVQPRVVKIYGAGGPRGLEPYQTGFLISPDGHLLTVWSYVLDTDQITATLWDGRRFEAGLVGADPRLEIALLKIDAARLPSFDLAQAVAVRRATRVLAFSNLFGVATRNEPASVQHGVVSVTTRLEARPGGLETPFPYAPSAGLAGHRGLKGPVYVLDAVTNNPGAAGGVVVTRSGELVAMLGKEIRNARNNTWLNYAVPIETLRDSVRAMLAGTFTARAEDEPGAKPDRPLALSMLGIVLVPDVLPRTPPYVDQVRPGSPAASAGIRADDLVLLVGDRLVQSSKALRAELEYVDRADPVRLTVLRGQELLEFELQAEGQEE